MSLDALTARANALCDDRDWRQFHNPKDMMLSLCLEAAELLEHAQWKEREQLALHLAENREQVGHELADVLHWTLLLAHDLGIDLEAAFYQKMDLNEQRFPVEKARSSAKKHDES